jgi:alpha-tubulin suppressor-like RCC1 family protein
MLVSDTGSVYTFGKDNFGGSEVSEAANAGQITTPKIVESLKGVFVVQAAIGGYFSAVLTREGQVYTFSWGQAERLGHSSDPSDVEPRLLPGLENVLIAHISAGNCYLLMLAYGKNGM